jgi:hypothetical protein
MWGVRVAVAVGDGVVVALPVRVSVVAEADAFGGCSG